MADAILIDLFKLVGKIVFQVAKQEIKLLVGVEEEVKKLQDRLGSIRALLDDAEERLPVKQRAEKLLLERLQNQYYEMDDIVDTWNTASIRADIEKKEGKPAATNAPAVVRKKVCSFVPSPSCCFNLPLRHDVGSMIRKLNEKLDKVLGERESYGIDFNRQPDVVERPTTTSFVDVSDIIGRDNYMDDLLSNLLDVRRQDDPPTNLLDVRRQDDPPTNLLDVRRQDDPPRNLLDVRSQVEKNSYRVISLVGMGGIGKTSLAQLAYDAVRANFQQRMWVCVSDPFDQGKVAKAIIKEVDRTRGDGLELQTLLREIQELIMGKKYFLVLDDVWTEDSQKWDSLKVALNNNVCGSRILVTTRKQRTAEVMGSDLQINLEVLSDEHCWSVLSKIAFSNEEQHTYLEDIGRKLAIKCGGLPLAAKLLGSLMQKNRSREHWNKILDSNLWEVEGIEHIEKSVLAPLLLSYNELTPTMRRCFSFCSVFAKDYVFRKDELVLHWMAQGYVVSKTDMEMEAEEYFEKLAMLSFFQDFQRDKGSDGKIISCKMHDIVHDFARLMTKKETFETDGNMEIDQSARHLHLKMSREMQLHKSIYGAKNLRTLFLLSNERYYMIEMPLLNSIHIFKCLRTLILGYPIRRLPNAVEDLEHLRYLHTSENVEIEELPETFCNLCNLQTLHIGVGKSLKKLPQGMGKLINLRHLIFAGGDIHDVVFPKGFGKLTGLRTLSVFNIGDKDDSEGCKLGELKNLNELRGTLTINWMKNVDNVDEVQNAQFKDKKHLRGLVLFFDHNYVVGRVKNDVEVLSALEPPPDLQYLKIIGYMGNTIYPNWMMSWTKLKKLELLGCFCLEHVPSLGRLPCLEVLAIERLWVVKRVGDEFLGIEDSIDKKDIFPNLKSLKFDFLPDWEEWIVTNPKIMPRLQSLQIFSCEKLKSLPDDLFTATSLTNLDIDGSPLLEERYRRGTGEDWSKISHISGIRLGSKYLQIGGKPDDYRRCLYFGGGSSDKSEFEVEVDRDEGPEICEVDSDEGPEICEADR